MSNEIRILIFGSTGTGKTSLCNALTGQEMQANSSGRGNTFETHTYSPISHEGRSVFVTDTVGLDESDSGTVPAKDAALQLVELIKASEAGYSLLVHVFRAPRRTKNHDENYQFFVDQLTQNQIPVILVATGCENEEPMSAWAEANFEVFSSKGCSYKALIAACFASGGRFEAEYAPLREESKAAVLEAVLKHSLTEPKKFFGEDTGQSAEDVVARAWNWFVDWVKLGDKYRIRANETAHSLLIRLGVPRPFADAAVEHVPDLVNAVARRYLPPGVTNIAQFLLSKVRR